MPLCLTGVFKMEMNESQEESLKALINKFLIENAQFPHEEIIEENKKLKSVLEHLCCEFEMTLDTTKNDLKNLKEAHEGLFTISAADMEGCLRGLTYASSLLDRALSSEGFNKKDFEF